ncbi:lytic transglycosylase domain-containing protein [Roseomonas sp. SXEYE002]
MRTVHATRPLAALLLASLLAGCGGGSYTTAAWDGRRGYDGNGDYGYDLNASRAEASTYRSHAARNYAVPGTADDPWGPHIRDASSRFQVPERWIRAVMRQESGGRLYDSSGYPITSPAGAMGLMQVMPRTYDTLRAQLGLGHDPYEPRDNILAGTAYIRQMYDRYGAPGFLAAYNAGPDRVDGYLSGAMILPDETINYLASAGPRLGLEVADAGPFSEYVGGSYRRSYASGSDAAYAGGGLIATSYGGSAIDDPSLRAFEGGGLVTPGAPTGIIRY